MLCWCGPGVVWNRWPASQRFGGAPFRDVGPGMAAAYGQYCPGVATIHIETSGRDYTFNHEQYDALVAELESQGASVSIEQLPEERGGLQNANEIVVRVGGLATTSLSLEALVAALKAHLRRRQVGPRIATIYGPDGREVLSTVELEDD
jgi:hypothetical protein